MKNVGIAVALFYLASLGGAPLAQAQQVQGVPVDFLACNFKDGKGRADLEKAAAKFRKWANEKDIGYAAWNLYPQYHPGLDFDVGWMGAWPDGEAFGVSMEHWKAPETEGLRMAIGEVIDCSGVHQMAVSLPINAPESTPQDGILMSYQCTLNDGVTMSQAYAAHLEAGTVMKGMGSLSVSWMFQPAIGAGNIDYDYLHAIVFYRYSDLGAAMDMHINNGGRVAQQKILSKVSSCKTPVIFDFVSVRARDER